MRYVDGYILPVPKKNLKAYTRMGRMGEQMRRKNVRSKELPTSF